MNFSIPFLDPRVAVSKYIRRPLDCGHLSLNWSQCLQSLQTCRFMDPLHAFADLDSLSSYFLKCLRPCFVWLSFKNLTLFFLYEQKTKIFRLFSYSIKILFLMFNLMFDVTWCFYYLILFNIDFLISNFVWLKNYNKQYLIVTNID